MSDSPRPPAVESAQLTGSAACTAPDRGPPARLTAVTAIAVVQGVALVVLAVLQVGKTISEHPQRPVFAVSAAAMTLAAGMSLAALGWAVRRLVGAARTPLVVLEVLALPIAWGLAQNGLWVYAGGVGAPALALVCLLATPAARAAFGGAE